MYVYRRKATMIQGTLCSGLILVMGWFHSKLERQKFERELEKKRKETQKKKR
jgi:hypothetical protein